MPTQAARVALWVPTTVPGAIGHGVTATATPAGAQAPIPTQFSAPAPVFASALENQNGTITGKAVDPIGQRTELVRLLGISTGTMQTGGITTSNTVTPGLLVKTGVLGIIDQALIPTVPAAMPDIIDAGTF